MKKKPMLVKRRYEEGGSWVKHNSTTNSYEFSNSDKMPQDGSKDWFWAEGRKLQNIKNNRSGSEGTVKGEYNYSSSRPNEVPYSIDQYGNYINKSTGQVINVSPVKSSDLGEKYTSQISSTKPGSIPIETPNVDTNITKTSTSNKGTTGFNENNRSSYNTWTSSDKDLARKSGTILTKEEGKSRMRYFRENQNPIKKSNLWLDQCTGKHGCLAYTPPINIIAQIPDLFAKAYNAVDRIGEDKKQRSLQAFRSTADKAKQELVQGTDPSQMQYNTVDASGKVIPKIKLADDYGRKIEQYDPTTGKYDKLSGRQTKKFYKSQDPNFGKKK